MNNIARAFTVSLAFVICSWQRSEAESPQATAESEQKGTALMELVRANLRRPFLTDAELNERLTARREDFEKLVKMAEEDNQVVRIAPDFTFTTSSMGWPRPKSQLGFSVERWNEYRQLFQLLGLEEGVLRPWDHPNAIYLIAQSKGLSIGGSCKGYAYSETLLQPWCRSLDQDRGQTEDGICFKPLSGNWYLYLEWD